MKCSLGISNFLKEISSLFLSIVFLYFIALTIEKGFLISPCYSLELCIQMGISFLFPGTLSDKEPTCQCRRHDTQVQSLGWEDPLEEGVANHSCILAWRIPWTEEPGGLQFMGHKELDTTGVT